ncbi:MAG: zinc-binding dehydrogenase, partial [Chloroflexaceae bacterium]|nr:zinc-binding dehydrogenase [Chloroflexaceae bacterium]
RCSYASLLHPINPSDLLFLRGDYGTRKPLPVIAGFEGSGVVVATGNNIRARLLQGRRVACGSPHSDGTWAEYLCIPANTCIPFMPDISTIQGASLIVNPLTAYALVDIARKGHRAALQTAAASSLGRMIVRLSQRLRFPMIHIVRRPEQVATLKAMGADYVLDSSTDDFDQQLTEYCQQLQATLVIDAVAGDFTGRILHAMPDGSRALVYGLLSGEPCQVDVDDLVFRRKGIDGFWLSDWITQKHSLALLHAAWQVQRLLKHDFQTAVRACFPLEDYAFALNLYEQRMSEGKVLFMPQLQRSRP